MGTSTRRRRYIRKDHSGNHKTATAWPLTGCAAFLLSGNQTARPPRNKQGGERLHPPAVFTFWNALHHPPRNGLQRRRACKPSERHTRRENIRRQGNTQPTSAGAFWPHTNATENGRKISHRTPDSLTPCRIRQTQRTRHRATQRATNSKPHHRQQPPKIRQAARVLLCYFLSNQMLFIFTIKCIKNFFTRINYIIMQNTNKQMFVKSGEKWLKKCNFDTFTKFWKKSVGIWPFLTPIPIYCAEKPHNKYLHIYTVKVARKKTGLLN